MKDKGGRINSPAKRTPVVVYRFNLVDRTIPRMGKETTEIPVQRFAILPGSKTLTARQRG